MKFVLLMLLAGSLSGCASIKPYIVCELGTGKAVVMQGVMGIGVGQELKDADTLCSKLSAPTLVPTQVQSTPASAPTK